VADKVHPNKQKENKIEYKIIFWALAIFIALKSISVGNEFNLYYWIKYKKKYIDWYFGRETFKQFLRRIKK